MNGFQQARVELGARLRGLREDASLNGKQLAERLGWPASKVSRIENARQTAAEDDVVGWGQALGAPAETVDELLGLLRAVLDQYGSLRQQLRGGLGRLQEDVRQREARTAVICAFDAGTIFGLLQTAEYARHIFAGAHRLYGGLDDSAEAVRIRVRRQEILYDPAHSLHLVLGEAALRYRLAPVAVMRGQIDRLLAVTSLDNLDFGIIPLEAPMPFPVPHGFWIYDDELVSVETATNELFLRDEDDVDFYGRLFEELRKTARYGEEARAILMALLNELNEPTA